MQAELDEDMANYRIWTYKYYINTRSMSPAEKVFHDCNREIRNTIVRRASRNSRLPEKENYFYFQPCNSAGCWLPIPGTAIGVPPEGLPTQCQWPAIGGVMTIFGTESEPTDPEVIESMEPYASLFAGPVPARCLPTPTMSGPSGAAAAPMGGGSASGAAPAAPNPPSGGSSSAWGGSFG